LSSDKLEEKDKSTSKHGVKVEVEVELQITKNSRRSSLITDVNWGPCSQTVIDGLIDSQSDLIAWSVVCGLWSVVCVLVGGDGVAVDVGAAHLVGSVKLPFICSTTTALCTSTLLFLHRCVSLLALNAPYLSSLVGLTMLVQLLVA
jgi:hypothetical protein